MRSRLPLTSFVATTSLFAWFCGPPSLQAQPSREYIRLGGRVIAIENLAASGFSVTPRNQTLAAGPNQSLAFSVTPPPSTTVTWSISPTTFGNIDQTTGSYQAPVCIDAQHSITVTATGQGGQPTDSTGLTLTLPTNLPLPNNMAFPVNTQCVAVTSITTVNSTVTINGDANVTFQAGSTISLEPGFHAAQGTTGTTFHAKIQ
jgi:hypothetical protein